MLAAFVSAAMHILVYKYVGGCLSTVYQFQLISGALISLSTHRGSVNGQ